MTEKLKENLIKYFKEAYPETDELDIKRFVEHNVHYDFTKKYEDNRLIIKITPVWSANDELLYLNKRV